MLALYKLWVSDCSRPNTVPVEGEKTKVENAHLHSFGLLLEVRMHMSIALC